MSKLYFRYGAMNSGKTTALLQVTHNYEEKGMHPIIIKPSIDTKGANKVISRIGIEREVDYLITSDYNIEVNINLVGVDAIIVDEAQFLTREQVEQLYRITKYYSVPVLCYGLRCDFQMQGFPGSTRLLEIADSLEELKTICSCGRKATQNLRLINGKPIFEGEQVEIDNQNDIKYDSVCGKCYFDLKFKGEFE